ncbi:MAG TPA: iron-sulfur cluster assembly protein, partial [Puia sp.]
MGEVYDPEVPVLSILDLGIVRDVRVEAGEAGPRVAGPRGASGEGGAFNPGEASVSGRVEVVITPTYSGCPAMDVIRMQIRMVLAQHGYDNVKVTT